MVIAIDIWKWPGMNVAFLVSFILATLMGLAVIPYAKRRPRDKPVTWGGAMIGACYAFAAFFIAFGIAPHQWIDHADKDLGWNKARIVHGPFDLLKPRALGGAINPITIPYEAIRDVIVVLIHAWFFGLIIWLWKVWQSRGTKPATTAIESSYGRPLVKKA